MIHSVWEFQLPLCFLLIPDFCPAMRRVLDLQMVTQCAVVEEFGIFLVLADRVGDVVV